MVRIISLATHKHPPYGEPSCSTIGALQSVTTSSLVLRTTTAAQATICTSLLAALVVKRRYSPISKIAKLSIFRGINGGLLDLLGAALSFKLKDATRSLKFDLFSLAFFALALLATQFFSTGLISDFDTAILLQFPVQTTRHNVALSESTLNFYFR